MQQEPKPEQDQDIILKVQNLAVSFYTESEKKTAVSDVSFCLRKEKTLGIVGESGCGKSVSALSIVRLLPRPGSVIEKGNIFFNGTDLAQAEDAKLREIRGKKIAVIFQEPMTSLNPVHTIGRQLAEVFKIHFPDIYKKDVNKKCIELLEKVQIPDPVRRIQQYPHQISGGMRQRVMIAMALAAEPDILIADEPTTALDVTVQAQILELMKEIQGQNKMSIIFITHDFGVISDICDDAAVLYAGKTVETGGVEDIFKNPLHPYTKGLLSSIAGPDTKPKTILSTIQGSVPAPGQFPTGCGFQNRCPYFMEKCAKDSPPLKKAAENRSVRCWLA